MYCSLSSIKRLNGFLHFNPLSTGEMNYFGQRLWRLRRGKVKLHKGSTDPFWGVQDFDPKLCLKLLNHSI